MSKEGKEVKQSGFKKCDYCSQKISLMDGHTSCAYCLGAVHLQDSGSIYHGFSSRVPQEHRNKLMIKGLLPFAEVLEGNQTSSKSSQSPKSDKSTKITSSLAPATESDKKLWKDTTLDRNAFGPEKTAPSVPLVLPELTRIHIQIQSPTLEPVSSVPQSPILQSVAGSVKSLAPSC